MKQLKLNGKKVRVFDEIYSPRAQIYPGYVQLNVGDNAPSIALTVPSAWWISDTRGSIRTSGNLIEKL